ASLASAGGVDGALRVARDPGTAGPFTDVDREIISGLAAAAGIALANAQRATSNDRAQDLALVMEMSREIGSTLDLDRVMRSVVNLAMRALPFDRGAIALYERGACDIRAVAGAETVDPDDPELKDLAVRAAWAAGVGESFYLSDRTEPASDAERLFLQIFGDDLAADGVGSGLYVPLKDEEGVLGILVLESAQPEFATERQRELIGILANQATVALRNAQLYHQVPLADALGALHARKEAFLALPRRRRLTLAVVVLVAVGALTLIRWPLRVDAIAPSFRPTARAEIRPLTDGIIERVLVREGSVVAQGAPLVQLRDAERRADLGAATAAVLAAERSAANAASRGDAAEERLQRMRAAVLRREAALREDELRATTIRAPMDGVVLTARPEERVGAWADAGSELLVIGRTDTLELEFLVDQRDVGRVRVGGEVRLRVDAFPQRTFRGRVSGIADVGVDTAGTVLFPVRALVPNEDEALRPGMVAYARVLTAPASVLGRAVREPARRLRLLWWRMWS
ncbi:MAG TPA: efflux RND transporter periplasmic adaptor subunit, partial [Gemmatimonadaceae bacterium]|nr:efflux RND transporter periplasmic adaptor subunit [Gemmatimonadaceae bacterium]